MKTIFITIFEGVEVKNILRTSILANLLLEKDLKIVLFTRSTEKVQYYSKEFPDSRLVFEVTEWKSQSKADRFFAKLKFVLLRTASTNLKRKLVCEYEGMHLRFYLGHALNLIFARPSVRRIARWLDLRLVKDNTYDSYFDKYQPNLVFLAHLFDEPEVALCRAAKKRNIATIGFINSWDKVTSRSIMRILPDKAVVFNSIVRDELIEFDEMKAEDIFVAGLPQYDYLFSRTPASREDFFNKIHADPHKELIVYASMGRAFSTSDWDMIDFLEDIVSSGNLKKPCELLIRFQPNDFVDEAEISKRPGLRYDYPGIRFGTKRGVDWDMNETDLNHLGDTLYHMSLLVCFASSISIDAVVFDKPVINIDFEIAPSKFLLKSPTQYYKSEHYQKALRTGGIVLAKSKEELILAVNSYLENRSLQSAERARLVREQCAFTDGKSGERIASFLLKHLEK